MSIRVRHTFINADWVARTTRPSGNMRKTRASRLCRRTLTFRNEAYSTASHQRSSGSEQRTAQVPRSRVSCEPLYRSSLGSFRGTKSPAWSWALGPKRSSSLANRTAFSNVPSAFSYDRARYYDANSGFISEDPIGFRGGIDECSLWEGQLFPCWMRSE